MIFARSRWYSAGPILSDLYSSRSWPKRSARVVVAGVGDCLGASEVSARPSVLAAASGLCAPDNATIGRIATTGAGGATVANTMACAVAEAGAVGGLGAVEAAVMPVVPPALINFSINGRFASKSARSHAVRPVRSAVAKRRLICATRSSSAAGSHTGGLETRATSSRYFVMSSGTD